MLEEKSTNYGNFDWEVDITRTFLCFLGLWPGTTFFRFFLILISIILVFLFPCIMSLFFVKENIENFVEPIGYVAYTLFVIAEMCLMRNNIHFISSIIQRMDDNWKWTHDSSTENNDTMRRYAIKSRCIVRFAILLTFICAGGYIIRLYLGALIVGGEIPKKVIKTAWYPFPLTNPFVIAATTILTIICVIISMLIFVSIDMSLIPITLHCAGQWTILSNTIRDYKGVLKHSVDNNDLSPLNLIKCFRKSCPCLKCIVDHHVALIQFTKIINKCFHRILFWKICYSIIHFCITGFIIMRSIQTRDITEFTLHIIYDFWSTISLFTYCWLGELLSHKNEHIERAIYEVEWFNQKSSISRVLILIIMRAQKQPRLTGGNFFILTVSFYKECIIASVSYLSVLIAIGLGKFSTLIINEKKTLIQVKSE